MTTPAAKKPTESIAGSTFGTMCCQSIDRGFMPIDLATNTNSRPVHERADDRASRPSTGMRTNVMAMITTKTRGIVVEGLKGSGLANIATIVITRMRVGIDNVVLKYMEITASTQPRRYAARIPKKPPITIPSKTVINAMPSEYRVPWMMAES